MYIQDEIHYFYWDWDFYKPFDYEPVSIHNHSSGKTILSRFHWHVVTIWTEPIDDVGKPSVEFTKLVHTPIVKSNSQDYRYLDIEPSLPVIERAEIVTLYIPLFDKALKSVRFQRKQEGYGRIIQDGTIPSKYLLDFSQIKAAIVVGKFPEPQELPKTLRDKIW